MLVKMLGDYSNVTESFPDVAAEAIVCTVQLLRSFNARAHELILEAKASKQFGGHLSKITGKQLALTSQSLGAILSLLPALRAASRSPRRGAERCRRHRPWMRFSRTATIVARSHFPPRRFFPESHHVLRAAKGQNKRAVDTGETPVSAGPGPAPHA
jgi:hypothetical protein